MRTEYFLFSSVVQVLSGVKVILESSTSGRQVRSTGCEERLRMRGKRSGSAVGVFENAASARD